MSNIIPSFYQYVSDITIDNPGSGYDSANPPTITISGGGGTGATATCTIFNGEIQSVTITNIGSGYTSTPSIAVSGSGGAVLTPVLAFANSSTSTYTEKSALGIKDVIPEFIRNEYSKFYTFVKKYYDYMDRPNSPTNIIFNKKFTEISSADDAIIEKWRLQLAAEFPKVLEIDKKYFYKHAKDIFESKGSQRAIKAFFRIVYNTEVDVLYPSQYVLRASDGRWIQEYAAKATPINNYEVLNLNGKLAKIKYYESTGTLTVLKEYDVTVARSGKITNTSPQTYNLNLKLPAGITSIPGPGAGAAAEATFDGDSIDTIEVTDGGAQYSAIPTVVINDSAGGSGAEAYATLDTDPTSPTYRQITAVTVTDGGSGYTDNTTLSILFYTDDIRTYVEYDNGARAYLERTLTNVSAGTYSGSASDAGFKSGQYYLINESGDDGRGYAYTLVGGLKQLYFAEDYVFVGGVNNAYIKVLTTTSSGVPSTWEIVDSGSGFFNAETEIVLTSPSGEDVTVTITTGYVYSKPGKWLDDRGKLSDVNKLQDNSRYQSYSYVIKSTIASNVWRTNLKNTVHPAGMEVFSDLIISSTLDYSADISIVTDGIDIYYFETDDVITTTDILIVNYSKIFTDSSTTSDSVSKSISIYPTDNTTDSGPQSEVGVNDSGDQTYFAQDYIDNDYYVREGGFAVSVGKVITDTANTLDVFVPVTTFVRSYSDSASVSDIVIPVLEIIRTFTESTTNSDSQVFNVGKSLTDSTSSIDDANVEIGLSIVKNDTSSTSDELTFNVNKILTDSTTNSDSVAFNVGKTLTDTSSTSELVSKAVSTIFNNSATATETSFVKNINKNIYEDVTATSTTNIGYEATGLCGGLLNCFGTAEDNITSININKILSDSTSGITDSGVITIQDYADPTYFAEDYVGVGYNF